MTDRPPISQFPRAVLDLFDAHVHGEIDRRGFLERCAAHVGGLATAGTVLAALTPDFAAAQTIAPTDPRISVSSVDIPSPEGLGMIRAMVARPTGSKKRGVVVVVHENRGLNPYIEDVARRLAVEGFIAVAPDGLSTIGGYPGDEDKARAAFATLDRAKLAEDFLAAARYSEDIKGGNGKLGATGFCYGGSVVTTLATRLPTLRASVPFYGGPPAPETAAAIRAELLVHLAGNDARVNTQWPPFEAALTAAGVKHVVHIYEGVEHGFHNDTTPRFNQAAATLAWQRTLDLFRRKLS